MGNKPGKPTPTNAASSGVSLERKLSGKALSAPVCVDLQTFPVQIHDGDIYIQIPD